MISLLLPIVIVFALVGLILWGLAQIPGIPPVLLTILYVVVGLILLIWLLGRVGGLHFP